MKSIFFLIVFLLFNYLTIYGQWQVELTAAEDVANPVNYPHIAYYPDGHISVLPDGNEYIMFWAEFESHRSVGSTQFVEDQIALQPNNAVFGRRGNFDTYDNGGSWLMSVFREQNNDFIGFFHAEDHWYPHTTNDIAWKSIGVTYSNDKGITWETGNQIITSATPKPATPTWGGTGDCCVVWDHINNRWLCYYQEQTISMAISTDPKGAPGTWKKYYFGGFTEDGLGGRQSPLPGLSSAPGGNPSVHWNTYLMKWVMVWHGWNPTNIYISVSADGIVWDTPKSIIVSEIGGRAWYPTIIGDTDVEAGEVAKIYYADIAPDFSYRKFKSRTITFFDPNLSVEDNKLKNDFLISPCPSNENIKLSGLPSGNKEIFIYNASGQLVYKEAFEGSNVEININRFASGLYYVKAQVGNQSMNKRFVKY
ncbi:T9SS type A sorting domain-containing protein [Gaetbulibacter aquiaggeris]|uniref:T9SS type A sorting domain-containing protein n=1 Tax=Gaetbulibacter aquiaggeris TaxID=1735373 RepID=A0ABW7MPS9_9FLAO